MAKLELAGGLCAAATPQMAEPHKKFWSDVKRDATSVINTSAGWREIWAQQRAGVLLRVFYLCAAQDREADRTGPFAGELLVLQLAGVAGQSVLFKPSQAGAVRALLSELEVALVADLRLREGNWR